MAYKLLIINPGSTSTKIGVYSDEKEVLVAFDSFAQTLCIYTS